MVKGFFDTTRKASQSKNQIYGNRKTNYAVAGS